MFKPFDHFHVYSILLTLLMAFLESYIQNKDGPERFKGNEKRKGKSDRRLFFVPQFLRLEFFLVEIFFPL